MISYTPSTVSLMNKMRTCMIFTDTLVVECWEGLLQLVEKDQKSRKSFNKVNLLFSAISIWFSRSCKIKYTHIIYAFLFEKMVTSKQNIWSRNALYLLKSKYVGPAEKNLIMEVSRTYKSLTIWASTNDTQKIICIYFKSGNWVMIGS